MSEQDRWLLPEGIEEVLPDEARRLEHLRRRLLDLVSGWGYELVSPPLIEYLDSLLTGTGRDLDLQTFKLTDQLTGRLMGLRADMTPQAARIDAHYLKRDFPVRLCYTGSVLRTRPDSFAGAREVVQLGAELFGHPGPESDIEIARLMLATLQASGITGIHLDLGHVGVFRTLARAAILSDDMENGLFEALQRKSRTEVAARLAASKAPKAIRSQIEALVELNGGSETLARARELLRGAPAGVGEALDNLERIATALVGLDIPLYFDFAELRGYRYYTGAVFSAFVAGQGQAVARGGRYDGIGQAFGRARAATGFGTDLRRLLSLTAASAAPKGVLAPADDDAGLRVEIARLRTAGERVVIQLPGSTASAQQLGCDRELAKNNGRWTVKAAN